EGKVNSTGSGGSSKDKLVNETKEEPMDEDPQHHHHQQQQQTRHPVQLVQQQRLAPNPPVDGVGSGSARLPFPAPSHAVQQQAQSVPSAVLPATMPRRPSDAQKQLLPSNGGVQGSAHPARGQPPSQHQRAPPSAVPMGAVPLARDRSAVSADHSIALQPRPFASDYLRWDPLLQQSPHAHPGLQQMQERAAAMQPQAQQGITMTTASGASAPLPVPRPPDHVMAMLQQREQQQLLQQRAPGSRVGGAGGGVMAPRVVLRDEAGRLYHGTVDYATGQVHVNLCAPPPLNNQGHFFPQHQMQQMQQHPQYQQQQRPQHGQPDGAQQ
ncbi:hypothetical protein PMAYCL1PPCAC_32748, partial [Pristionchus mayeri]